MTPFAVSSLLIAIVGPVMAGLVYFTSQAKRVHQLWAFFCMALSVWGFGGVLVAFTPEPDLAMVSWRIAHVGVILIPVLFYHFVITFVGISRPRTLKAAYGVGGAFLLANVTPWFISHMRMVFGQFYYDSPPGLLYIPFVFFFIGMLTVSHVELWRFLGRTQPGAQRHLTRWLLIGTTIGFGGGATCFLPVFGIDLYPHGNFAISLFPLIMMYAFLRHRLVDLSAIAVRGLLFLITYVIVVAVPFLVGYHYQVLWRAVLGPWWWTAPVVLMGLLASVIPAFFLFFVHRMETRVFHAQRRYHRTLVTASGGMTRIKGIVRLCRLITYMVNRTVGLTNAGLFLYDPQEQRYAMQAVRYQSQLPSDLSVEQADPLVQLLQEKKDLLLLEEVEAGRIAADRKTLRHAAAWMRQLEARLLVPSFSGERLLGFLVLGAKRSSEPYTTDDIAIFSGLANQAALAIENALYFEELRTSEAYMIQSEKMASIGQLASGMAHEIHNPLTVISGEAQLYMERFRGRDPQVDALLTSIVDECKRAADITRRILRFAKPAPADVNAVDLRATIDESLTLAGYQVNLARVERTVQVPDDIPKVRSNQNQLQEVLLNLILNACQAMGQQGGKLMLSATGNGASVTLRVSDNGPGIPAKTLRKVFDPFYTTKASGTGLGLFVTQRILQSHGGSISLESTEGQGTCFTILLPVWTEHAATPSAAQGS